MPQARQRRHVFQLYSNATAFVSPFPLPLPPPPLSLSLSRFSTSSLSPLCPEFLGESQCHRTPPSTQFSSKLSHVPSGLDSLRHSLASLPDRVISRGCPFDPSLRRRRTFLGKLTRHFPRSIWRSWNFFLRKRKCFSLRRNNSIRLRFDSRLPSLFPLLSSESNFFDSLAFCTSLLPFFLSLLVGLS